MTRDDLLRPSMMAAAAGGCGLVLETTADRPGAVVSRTRPQPPAVIRKAVIRKVVDQNCAMLDKLGVADKRPEGF